VTATRPPLPLWYLPPGVAAPATEPCAGDAALPPITPELVRAATAALDRVAPALAATPIASIVAAIDAAVARLQTPGHPLREIALDRGPKLTGYSRSMLAHALDAMLAECRAPALRRLLASEIGDAAALDGFASGPDGALWHARGRGRQLHIYAGTVPTVPVLAIARALLLKSPVLAKPSHHDPLLPVLFARALAESAPVLGAAVAVLPWRGGDAPVEEAALAGAGAVLVHGRDETVTAWRRRVASPDLPFAGHGHRLSIAVVARSALTRANASALAGAVARDVALFDGRGCLSCRLIVAERGGEVAPADFAALVARELAALERRWPRGVVEPEESARIQALRAEVLMRCAAGEEARLWASEGGTAWTVLYDVAAQRPAPAGRVALIVPLDDLAARLPALIADLPLSAVALAADEQETAVLLPLLARHATRICPPGRLGEPPLTWRQDGLPTLATFVRWVGYEQSTS
jgi:hypothetical protein